MRQIRYQRCQLNCDWKPRNYKPKTFTNWNRHQRVFPSLRSRNIVSDNPKQSKHGKDLMCSEYSLVAHYNAAFLKGRQVIARFWSKCSNVMIMICRWVLIRSANPLMRRYFVLYVDVCVCVSIAGKAACACSERVCVLEHTFHQNIFHINVQSVCHWTNDMIKTLMINRSLQDLLIPFLGTF